MKTIRLYLTILLTLVVSISTSAATYRLQKVTAVKAGGLYVFEQDGYVMSNKVSSYKLQTENEYLTSGLTGIEKYVWKLEKGENDAFKMRNMSLSSNQFLYIDRNGKNIYLKLGANSEATSWTFTFQEDETVLIHDKKENRYLAYTSNVSHEYKTYVIPTSQDKMENPHSINVFELVEEGSVVSTVAKPVFSPEGGMVTYGTTVTLEQPEAIQILYTVDGTVPTLGSDQAVVYESPIAVTRDMTVKAVAVDTEGVSSDVAEATFTVKRPNAPVFNPSGGRVDPGTEVIITGDGVKILYTLDGSNPSQVNENSMEYAVPIVVDKNITLKAIVVDEHGFESAVVSASYVVNNNMAEIDMRGRTESLVFSDFSKAGSGPDIVIQGPFPASDGMGYAGWKKEYCYYDKDDHQLLHMIGEKGLLISPRIISDRGIMVRVVYGSKTRMTLSMGDESATGEAGGDKYNQPSCVELATTSIDTFFTLKVGGQVAYVKTIEIIPLNGSSPEIPTAIRSVSDTSFSSQGKIAYNLAGQRVGAGYRGLVIVDGKAVLKR